MRKLIYVLILSILMTCPQVYGASYYEEVNVRTTFADDIDLNEIDYIEVVLEDSTEFSKEYLLERANNYTLKIDNVPIGAYSFQYGVVNNDEIGYYNVSADVNIDELAKKIEVVVNVVKQNNAKKNNYQINSENREMIKGTNIPDNSGLIIEDEPTTTTTTEATNKDEIAIKKEQIDQEKQKNRQKNSLIGKILFSIIGIVVCVLGIFVAVKISNANK